jgi:hypothetical protein
MYILILTALFAGVRVQYDSANTEDTPFDTCDAALRHAEDLIIEGYNSDDIPEKPQAFVINTKDHTLRVYNLKEEPRRIIAIEV